VSEQRLVRPYGDDTDDGRVQISFTLPVPPDALGEAAARELARRMGIDRPQVVHRKAMGANTFFIVYGPVRHEVDLEALTIEERPYPVLDHDEIDGRIREAMGRKAVVVGASLGTDAHTVGLDAILSMKGWAGEKGLESYRSLRVINLRSQVDPRHLAERAGAEGADAVLVSQTVTQRDAHLHHLRQFVEAVEEMGLRGRFLLIAGGAGLDPETGIALGYDRAFGKGASPREVASYLAWALGERANAG
jgi:beta-lysine 5,6-aminomutase beta subunit